MLRLCVVHRSAPFEGRDGASNVGLSRVSGPLDCGTGGESAIADGSPFGCFSYDLAHVVRTIESAIRILMDEDPSLDGVVALCLAGCCVGTCATIFFCWEGNQLVSIAGGGFLLCSTYFWTSTR